MGQVGSALGDVDLAEASDALERADRALADARDRSGRPWWSVASVVPVVRHPIELTREIIEVSSVAVDLGQTVLVEGEEILGDGAGLAIEDGRVDLEPLFAAAALMQRLPIDQLVTARDALAIPRSGWVPGVLRDARTDTLALADRVTHSAVRGRALTTALPGYLGADGPRRYFVGMQTSAELRGTGGLIGFFGVLDIDDGLISFGGSEVYEPADDDAGPPDQSPIERIGTLGGSSGSAEADPAFVARYGAYAADSFFSNINLDPDLPSTAAVALELFELRTGQRLDGMILVDPDGLEQLLIATGSTLPLPAEFAAASGMDEIATDRFSELVTVDIYEVFGSDRSRERKDALKAIGDAAMERVFAGGWAATDMGRAVVDATVERHLQVYSADADEQAAFTSIGAGGALTVPIDADLLAVTANNAVGGKQDVHLGHAFDVEVRLGDVRRSPDGLITAQRTTAVEVIVDNPLPTSGMDEYILGNCMRDDGGVRCFEGPPGVNQTWFSAWLPDTTEVIAARTDDDDRVAGLGRYRGFTVLDHFQTTPSQGQASFQFEGQGRVPMQVDAGSLVYELQWWRQSKATPDLLDVTVHPPAGWSIVDVEVVGGGRGRGAGFHGDRVELTASTEDGVARLYGTVTAHTRLRVHLTGPDA